jgi:hypothetical protein
MSVSEFLDSEVIGKKRVTLVSSLLRRFGYFNFFSEIEKFANNNSSQIELLTSESVQQVDGSIDITIVHTEKVTKRLFAVRPRESNETISAVFKRDMEEVRSEISKSKAGLWTPEYALVGSTSCEERGISVPVISAPAAPVSRPTENKIPKPASSMFSKAPVKSVSASQPKVEPTRAPVKFQVPLDKLDDPNDTFVDKESPVEKENSCSDVVMEAPQVVSVSSSVASAESPVAKRQRTEPEYREVIIKKKVKVTEYEMRPNGGMIVKDVERMVEEKKMELVRPPSQPMKSASSSVSSAGSKNEPKPAKPGQSTLAGFFKPKN